MALSWAQALKAAQQSFATYKKRIPHTDRVVVINYDTWSFDPKSGVETPDRLRVYDVKNGVWQRIRSTWVSHAASSGMGCANQFSNKHESFISSKGAFVTAKQVHKSPNFGYNRWGRLGSGLGER